MKWAIITGASSGIGRALAFEFAADHFNLLLTGRNEEDLNAVAGECVKKYSVQTEVVIADLSCSGGIDKLVDAIGSGTHRYEALVNNAGFGIHGDFASTKIEENIQLVHLQLDATLRLTRAVLPGMIQQKTGRILNVASVYSYSPVPFQSTYAACKAFLLSFSASLQNELTGTGVTVTVFCPGITQTNFRSRAGIGEKRIDTGMKAEDAARIAFRETMRDAHVVIPGLANRAFVFVARLLPVRAASSLVRFINKKRGQDQ
jgi:short-subunit dehydrogenase